MDEIIETCLRSHHKLRFPKLSELDQESRIRFIPEYVFICKVFALVFWCIRRNIVRENIIMARIEMYDKKYDTNIKGYVKYISNERGCKL